MRFWLPHWYRSTGALTIYMENPEISGKEVKWNYSFRWKFSGKKVIPFEVLPFSYFYGNDRNFLYHLFGLPSARLHVERKQKITGTLKMVQLNPVPVFVAKKYTSTIWRKFCTKISVQMVNTSGDVSVGGPRDLPVTRSESAYQSSKPFIGLAQLQIG